MRYVPLLFLVAVGCTEEPSEPDVEVPFAVAGAVVDGGDAPVPGVMLDFGTHGTATSGLDGKWSKSNLSGLVTITPSKDGWGFTPGSLEIEEGASDLTFVGSVLGTFLEVVVDWAQVGGSDANLMFPESAALKAVEPTHFGTRLEYPDANAFFAQSLTRESAEEFGLITLEVPASDSTDLFIAAVRLNDVGEGQVGQRDPIVWFGQLRGLEIVEGSATTVRMEDVEWAAPVWSFEDETVRDAYESGKMIAPKDSTNLDFVILVRDPFGGPWAEFIGLNGIGGAIEDSEDGWWRVRVFCQNDLVGQAHDSTCTFWPYLHAEKFNLPDNTRFSVPPVTTTFAVEWR